MSKLSFTTMATPGMGALESIRAARRYGYDGVDLRVSDYMGELTPDSSPGDIAEIRSAFWAEGIQASGLLCYNEHGGREGDSWSKMRESILKHLEIAALLGSPSIRIFGGNPGDFAVRGDFIKRTAEVLAEVLAKSGRGLTILVQNHGNSYKASEIAELVRQVGDPALGMAYSPDHSYIEGESIEDVIAESRGIIKQLYIADVIDAGNEYKGILPGRGKVPLAAACRALGGPAFEGWLTFKWEKIWQKSLEEPDTALPYFIGYIRSLE